MGVSRESIGAKRFGYGFRPGERTDTGDVDALLAQIPAATARPPLFATESYDERWALHRAQNLTVRAKRQAKGAEEARLAGELKALKGQTTGLLLDDVHERVAQAVLSPHGFYERLAYFWANHFAISIRERIMRTLTPFYERDAIRPHIGGSFRQMLGAAVTHPAMILFLDQQSSVGPNSRFGRRQGRGLNENLAREILELHTLGVNGGYTQADVTEFAKLLTGLIMDRRKGRTRYARNAAEPGVKTVLGERYGVDAGVAGMAEIERALDRLAAHPSTRAHLCGKLARHFVGEAPPPALLRAMEAAWTRTEGDLPSVYRALLSAKASWESFGEKIKTPFDLVVSGMRAVGAEARDLGRREGGRGQGRANLYTVQALLRMNHRVWNPGGPDGFSDANADWLTPQGLAGRLEWASRVGRGWDERLDPRALMKTALADTLRPDTRFVVTGAAERWEGIALVLASPEFNRR